MHPTSDTVFYKIVNAIGDICERACRKMLFIWPISSFDLT